MTREEQAAEDVPSAEEALSADSWATTDGVVGSGVPVFEEWASEEFRAEYFFRDGDFIAHFFPPSDRPAGRFQRRMGEALEATAPGYFKAGLPRLQAKYSEELDSYWLQARGAGHGADPDALACRYFEKLDRCLTSRAA